MRLPQQNLENLCFLFRHPDELVSAMGVDCSEEEAGSIRESCELGLPPVTSIDAVATMFGYNPGFIWSLAYNTRRHYRFFPLRKGHKIREIEAPKVGLKAIQKWLSFHFAKKWLVSDNTYGFVQGRSHVHAAKRHLGAKWVLSNDIENFFPSISEMRVRNALRLLGYKNEVHIALISKLCCLDGHLVQGSPASPVLSNIVLKNVDALLSERAALLNCTFTRYADDIVISGQNEMPPDLFGFVQETIERHGWTFSEKKSSLSVFPKRLKVHGLLVHSDKIRLTKGYRNKIRAFRYVKQNHTLSKDDNAKISGHLNYAKFVEEMAELNDVIS